MDLGLGQVNVKDLPQSDSFEPLKPGWYTVQIEKAEVKPTKAGTGSYLNIQYKVNGPTSAGRVVFGTVTLRNPNPTAEEIGRQNLGDLCRACGLIQIQDSDMLIGKNLEIKLELIPAVMEKDPTTGEMYEKWPAKNNVKGYRAINAQPSTGATGAATSSGPIGGPAAPPSRPW